jgi:hypothetical protein
LTKDGVSINKVFDEKYAAAIEATCPSSIHMNGSGISKNEQDRLLQVLEVRDSSHFEAWF